MVAAGCPVVRSKTVIGEGGVGPSRGRRDSCPTASRLPSPENPRAETSAYSFSLSRALKRATFWSSSRRSQRTRISVGGLPTPAPLLYFIWGGISPSNDRSEEHTSELQSRVDISYAVFCLK